MEKNIIISIQRDAKNIPFARVYYNGQDAFSMDDSTKIFAGCVARKSVTSGMLEFEDNVYVSLIDGSVLAPEEVKLLEPTYCISGCERGEENVKALINRIACGATNDDIRATVTITDGKTAVEGFSELDSREQFYAVRSMLSGTAAGKRQGM